MCSCLHLSGGDHCGTVSAADGVAEARVFEMAENIQGQAQSKGRSFRTGIGGRDISRRRRCSDGMAQQTIMQQLSPWSVRAMEMTLCHQYTSCLTRVTRHTTRYGSTARSSILHQVLITD